MMLATPPPPSPPSPALSRAEGALAWPAAAAGRRFLFLQGPISPFFAEVADGLRALGHVVHRINLSLGDRLFWRSPGAVDWRGDAAGWPGFVAEFLTRHAITDLVLLGEERDYHRAAIAAAKEFGARVTVTDFGYFRPDWITLEEDAMGGASRFPREPEAILALAAGLPPAELDIRYRDDFRRQALWDVLYHLANLLPGPFPHYRSHQLRHPVATYLGVARRLLSRRAEARRGRAVLERLRGRHPFWLFAMQLENDFAVRAYSDYAGLRVPILETLASFAAHAPAEARLLFKVHPLDPCLTRWEDVIAGLAAQAGMAGRAEVVRFGPLDAYLEAARGMITINSTAGMRAVVLGRPVIALGRAVYRVPGIAFTGGLDRFWTEAAPPEPRLRAAFLAALQASTQIRGVFYGPEGRAVAVANTVARLHEGVPAFTPPAEPPESV